MSAKIPTLLALDTATPVSSAAVTGEGLSVQKIDESGAGHSESLIGEVDAVLREAGVSLSDCDAVVFGAGPGAFTGLRVACGVAQGLAWAKEKPIVAASNLEALAMKELSGETRRDENPRGFRRPDASGVLRGVREGGRGCEAL